MARFGVADMDNYGGGNGSFFSLKNDKDTARIRFLYNDSNDIEGVSLHEVQVGNGTIDVECLRAYNEPVDKCPLCAEGYEIKAKLFVPIYDVASGESKIWTKGKKFIPKLSSLCTRFNPLVSTIFEVERNGKKGDTSTTYETYNISTDNSRVEDFPEIKAEGIAFYSKSYEEMENYLNTGSFDIEQQVMQRGTRQAGTTHRQAQRQTPVNTPVRRRPTYTEEDNF